MKKLCMYCILLLVLCALPFAQAATPLGFGYINANRTNVRKSIGGPIVTRLNDGDAVFIMEKQTDRQGRDWYHVNTEHRNDKPSTVWVQADYITAGSALFHDIVQVAAGDAGMLALQSDGRVTGVANENRNTRVFRQTIAGWHHVRQVSCGFMTYLAVLEDNSLRGFGNMAYEDWDTVRDVRLLDGQLTTIAYVTQDGVCNQESFTTCYTLGQPISWQHAQQITACAYGVIALYPEGNLTCLFHDQVTLPVAYHALAGWDGLASLACGHLAEPTPGSNTLKIRPLLVGLAKDGTVSTVPQNEFPALDAWANIQDVKAGWNFVIGLRADGTVLAAGGEDYGIPAQVAQWEGITAIDAVKTYCVGITTNGTLLFAGTYTF